ncbi:MAG: hypothetical protein AAF967_06060, partial [Pseudomonadota bacterium]
MTAFAERICEVPDVFDADRGVGVLATMRQAWARDPMAARASSLLDTPEVASFLTAVFSGSPFLAALSERNPDILAACLTEDPDTHLSRAADELDDAMSEATSEAAAM